MTVRRARASHAQAPMLRYLNQPASDSARAIAVHAATWAIVFTSGSVTAMMISVLVGPWHDERRIVAWLGILLLHPSGISWGRAQEALRKSVLQRAASDPRNRLMWRVCRGRRSTTWIHLSVSIAFFLFLAGCVKPGRMFGLENPHIFPSYVVVFLFLQGLYLGFDSGRWSALKRAERSPQHMGGFGGPPSPQLSIDPEQPSAVRLARSNRRSATDHIRATTRQRLNQTLSNAAQRSAADAAGWASLATAGAFASIVISLFPEVQDDQPYPLAALGVLLLGIAAAVWFNVERVLHDAIMAQSSADPNLVHLWHASRSQAKSRRSLTLSAIALILGTLNALRPELVHEASNPYVYMAFVALLFPSLAYLVVTSFQTEATLRPPPRFPLHRPD